MIIHPALLTGAIIFALASFAYAFARIFRG